jgi:hypothetical protein
MADGTILNNFIIFNCLGHQQNWGNSFIGNKKARNKEKSEKYLWKRVEIKIKK